MSGALETTEEFGNRFVAAIDSAGLAILVSVGHQTGLLDTMAGLPPATSMEIAEAAGLEERYVREWLGGMTTGQIVEYDAGSSTYSLPAHRAGMLTRAAGPDNLAVIAQFVSLLGEVEQKVIRCFREGGGVPYSEYPRFHKLMAEMSGMVFDAALIDVVLPLVDGLPDRLRGMPYRPDLPRGRHQRRIPFSARTRGRGHHRGRRAGCNRSRARRLRDPELACRVRPVPGLQTRTAPLLLRHL